MINAKFRGECPRCGETFSKGVPIISDNKRWYPVDCEGCERQKKDFNSLVFARANVPMDTVTHVLINCETGFERSGSHESVGIEWTIELQHIPHHYLSTAGWRRGATDKRIKFTGKTLMIAMGKVSDFLMWYNEQ
jgi:hypothetical protein